ncbi:MAG: glycosyltransferase family 4 protein [Planctomycetota bacterium]
MKISVVGFNFSAIGGLEIVSKAIASVLARRGQDVECLALHESGTVAADGFRIAGMMPGFVAARSLAHRMPSLFPQTRLRNHLRDADIVIAAHAQTLPRILAIVESFPSRPIIVTWLHGREVWASLGRRLPPWLRKSDRRVAGSDFTADTVRKLRPAAARPTVIHDPVDTDVFLPAPSPADIRRHHILTVGRHDPDSHHKGYDVLIEAMGLLRRSRPDLPLKLTITGTGALLENHRRQIADRSLGDVVSLAGRVSRETLRSLYQTTDLFAFPSRHESANGEEFGEGFGVVNAEAAASGRPVITSTHGGCPETVIDGITGFAIDPTSPALVARKIEDVFDMPVEERDAMGARGRAMAVERFSTAVFEQSVGDFVEQCAAGARMS